MAVKQVVPGVYQVGVKGVNVFIVDHDGLTLVDTGLPKGHDAIVSALKKIDRTPSDVTSILISHYHWDHVGNLRELKESTGATVYAARGDADLLRSGGPIPPIRTRGVVGAAIKKFAASSAPLPPMPVDEEIEDGDHIPAGDGLKVVGTPGHTPGHLCFLWPEQGGVLFATDAAFNVRGTKLQPAPLGEDFETSDRSFVKLSEQRFEVAAFAHGPAITSGASAKFAKVAAKYR
jgi:glyoxylase-like metal-dependent hydrolase (beta-lactamase superfamily II)